MSKASLKASNIHVQIGSAHILCNLGLVLHPGELCGLIGPSGAGKSTFIKVLLGLRKATKGQVLLGGEAVSAFGRVGYVPQDDALHKNLKVEDALRYSAELWLHKQTSEQQQAQIKMIAKQMGLEERLTVPIRSLSGGQRKRVSVALELLHKPNLLILDEPTSGLDPGLEKQMMSLFKQVAQQDRILLVATHAMQSLCLCNVLLVMIQGRFAYAGPPQGALEWFGVNSFAGIFEQLPKHSPAEWSNRWLRSSTAQEFSNRKPPTTSLPSSKVAQPKPELSPEEKWKQRLSNR